SRPAPCRSPCASNRQRSRAAGQRTASSVALDQRQSRELRADVDHRYPDEEQEDRGDVIALAEVVHALEEEAEAADDEQERERLEEVFAHFSEPSARRPPPWPTARWRRRSRTRGAAARDARGDDRPPSSPEGRGRAADGRAAAPGCTRARAPPTG